MDKTRMLGNVRIVVIFLIVLRAGFGYSQSNEPVQLAQEYLEQGEIRKAKELYDDLANKKRNVPVIHTEYFKLLVDNGYIKEAKNYVKKIQRWYPDNILYQIDEGVVYNRSGDSAKSKEVINEVTNSVDESIYKVRIVANHLIRSELTEYAEDVYLKGREKSGNPFQFSVELANLYRRLNKKDKMIQEFLNYAQADEGNVSYVKNVLQNILSEDEELDELANLLYGKVQENPDEKLFGELLIWVNLQQKNFYGAFIQARALDRRNRSRGSEVMDVAEIAFENEAYDNALKMYEYVVDEYPGTSNYLIARRLLIRTREELVKNKYPVNKEEISKLIEGYQDFINESSRARRGIDNSALEAQKSQALLYAFYMDEKDIAIQKLQEIINHPRVSRELRARSKLVLGDIYILIGEPWESTLLYSQVEKEYKEELVGYEAKLRNAKLSYYKGDFELAQGHLDVLKLATTREIANDALFLSLLIQNNTAFDSTEAAMKNYAAVDLLLFQNKQIKALEKLEEMLQKYSGHPLTDEINWLLSKIHIKLGNTKDALDVLNVIRKQYPEDILGDDAFYEIGKIYEDILDDKDKAMEIYKKFLTNYPGSIYIADVRKRFRILRGDFNIN